jgi:hypothetical protein
MLAPLLGNRVVQFLSLGALIFFIAPRQETSRDIVLTRETLDALERAQADKRGRVDALEVDERAIEDELLYREALRIGFDRNDPVVRQRLIQKVLFLAEELEGAADPPKDAELERFFASNRARWLKGARYHLRQVFLKDEVALEALAKRIETKEISDAELRRLGDPCPMPREIAATIEELAAWFGRDFAEQIARRGTSETARSTWIARSAFGSHLVTLEGIDPGRMAAFAEVKDRVREVYVTQRREDAIARYLEKAFGRYRVSVGGSRIASITPLRRLAFRTESSGED